LETLQEILEKSRTIETLEFWKPPHEYHTIDNYKDYSDYMEWEKKSYRNCFKEKWNIDIHSAEKPYLILEIENDKIIKVGFTHDLGCWMCYKICGKGIRKWQFYIKDLTNENINYDNFREYKKKYIKEFINA